MKNLLNVSLAIALLFSATLMSCKNDGLQPTEQPSDKFISFKGETIKIPANFPEELFGQTQEEFDSYMNGKTARKAREINSANLTYDEILEIFNKHLVKYPRVNYDSISNEDLKRILVDIPSIKSLEDALSKVDFIFDYYNTIVKNDIIPDVLALEKSKLSAKISGGSPGSLTDPERNVLLGNPTYGAIYAQAANDANYVTMVEWGVDIDNQKNNAFKHSLWNCLIIRGILGGAPASKTQAINFAQNGTSAHEKNNDGSQNHTPEAAMDLHNNMSARNWMDDEVKWGIGPFRKMPNFEKIKNTWYARANSSTFYDKSTN